jgi:hypothetical protein
MRDQKEKLGDGGGGSGWGVLTPFTIKCCSTKAHLPDPGIHLSGTPAIESFRILPLNPFPQVDEHGDHSDHWPTAHLG